MPPVGGWKTGVYCIRNLLNEKRYVGSAAVSFRNRWNLHRATLNTNSHHNSHLQAAWNKYGESAFEFVILERCHPSRCIETEQKWLDDLETADPIKGYNYTPTAGSCLGMKLTKEMKEKIGRVHKGKVVSEETRRKIGNANRGKKRVRSPEYCKKLSDAIKGKSKSVEHKSKLSASAKLQPRAGGRYIKKG